jgi:hypothetical protein
MQPEAGLEAESFEHPVSPELVLVADPDEARLAREQLPDVRVDGDERSRSASAAAVEPANSASDDEWMEFLAGMRAREAAVADAAVAAPASARGTRGWLVIGGVLVLAVAAAVAAISLRHDGDKQAQPAASARAPVPRSRRPAVTRASNPRAARPRPAAKRPTATPARRPRAAAARPVPKPTRKRATSRRSAPTAAAAGFVPARIWSWPPRRGAHGYLVQFFRNGRQVLQARTAGHRYVLPESFTFRPGRYRWTVTPLGIARPTPLVDSAFVVS